MAAVEAPQPQWTKYMEKEFNDFLSLKRGDVNLAILLLGTLEGPILQHNEFQCQSKADQMSARRALLQLWSKMLDCYTWIEPAPEAAKRLEGRVLDFMVAILDRPEFDLSNFAPYIKQDDINSISAPLASVPALELKAMEQYCINMAHTLRYLFDKMRKISAHPQHAKDLTPAGWKRFCVRVLAVAYFRLPLLQQPILHAACTANQSDKKVLYNDINKLLLAPKPRLGEEKKHEDMIAGGIVDPKSIELSLRVGGGSAFGVEGGIEMTTKSSVRASVLMDRDRKDSVDSDDDDRSNTPSDAVARMHALLDTPAHSASLCHACAFPWQERMMTDIAEWRHRIKPHVEGTTQEIERPTPAAPKKVATMGSSGQSSMAPTSPAVATSSTGVAPLLAAPTPLVFGNPEPIPTGPVNAPKPLTAPFMGRAESVDIMGASPPPGSGPLGGTPSTRVPSFSLSVPRGMALAAAAASSGANFSSSPTGSQSSGSFATSSASSSSSSNTSVTVPVAAPVVVTPTAPIIITPSASPDLPASLVASAAVSMTIAPQSRAHHAHCLCDQRRDTFALFSPRYGLAAANQHAPGAAFVRIGAKHAGPGFDMVRWRWFADIHQKAWGGDLVDDQLMRCLIESFQEPRYYYEFVSSVIGHASRVYRTNAIAWELVVGYGQLVSTFLHMMMTRLTQSANNPPPAGPAGSEPRCPPTMKRCQAILMLNPDLLTFIMEIMLRTTRLTSTDSVVENWQCVHQWFTVCTRGVNPLALFPGVTPPPPLHTPHLLPSLFFNGPLLLPGPLSSPSATLCYDLLATALHICTKDEHHLTLQSALTFVYEHLRSFPPRERAALVDKVLLEGTSFHRLMGHWNYHVRRIMLYILLYHLCFLAHPVPSSSLTVVTTATTTTGSSSTPGNPQPSPPNSPLGAGVSLGVPPPLKTAPSASPNAPLLPADTVESKSDGRSTPSDAPVHADTQSTNGDAPSCWSCFCCFKSSPNSSPGSSVSGTPTNGGNGGNGNSNGPRGSTAAQRKATEAANKANGGSINQRIPVNDQGNRAPDHMIVVMQMDQPLHERVTRCVDDFKNGRIPAHLAVYCHKTLKELEVYTAGYRKLQEMNAALTSQGEHVMPREVPIDNAGEASGGGQQAGVEQSQWQREKQRELDRINRDFDSQVLATREGRGSTTSSSSGSRRSSWEAKR